MTKQKKQKLDLKEPIKFKGYMVENVGEAVSTIPQFTTTKECGYSFLNRYICNASLAEANSDLQVVQFLIDNGADPNECLGEVIHGGDIAVAELLVQAGADPNRRANHGYTPLMKALLSHSSLEGIKFLIDSGADVNAVDRENRTALDLVTVEHGKFRAPYKTFERYADLLLERGATQNGRSFKPRKKTCRRRLSSKPRDSQRSKVYKAEGCFEKLDWQVIENIEEGRRFVNYIFSQPSFKDRFPQVSSFRIENGSGRSSACGWAEGSVCCMKIQKSMLKPWIILHELAHGIVQVQHGRYNFASHGPEWCTIYLELVDSVLGASAYRKLTASFERHRVRYIIALT